MKVNRNVSFFVFGFFGLLFHSCSNEVDTPSVKGNNVQLETVNQTTNRESDSLEYVFGTITQERNYLYVNHQIDVGTAKFVPLRERPISKAETEYSNTGGEGPFAFNNHLIIKYLHNGDFVELLDSTDRFYKVRAVDYSGIVEGYIIKSISKSPTLVSAKYVKRGGDRILPFCKTFVSKEFQDILVSTNTKGKEKFMSAINGTVGNNILFKVFLGGCKRSQGFNPSRIGSSLVSRYVTYLSTDFYLFALRNNDNTFMLEGEPPALIKKYSVSADTLIIDILTTWQSARPEISVYKLYPLDKLDPNSKVWVLDDTVSMIDISVYDNYCNTASLDVNDCLNILENYLQKEVGPEKTGYLDNYGPWLLWGL